MASFASASGDQLATRTLKARTTLGSLAFPFVLAAFFAVGAVLLRDAIPMAVALGWFVLGIVFAIPRCLTMSREGIAFGWFSATQRYRWADIEAIGVFGDALAFRVCDAIRYRHGGVTRRFVGDDVYDVLVPGQFELAASSLAGLCHRYRAAASIGRSPASKDVYCATMTVRGDDMRTRLVICIGHKDPATVAAVAVDGCIHQARKHTLSGLFSGVVDVVVIPPMIENSSRLRELMDICVATAEGRLEADGVRAQGSRSIRIRWSYGYG